MVRRLMSTLETSRSQSSTRSAQRWLLLSGRNFAAIMMTPARSTTAHIWSETINSYPKTSMQPEIVLAHEFVEFIPEQLKERTLYISKPYQTAVHKCCCG